MKFLSFIFFMTVGAFASYADILELRDGKLLNGTYQGGTAGTIRFESSGQMQVLPVNAVLALTISRAPRSGTVSQSPPSPPPPVRGSSQPQQPHFVPAGSDIIVKLRSELSTVSARSGDKFDAILQNDLRAGSVIIAPKGSLVKGTVIEVRRPRRLIKVAVLAFTLDEVKVGENAIRLTTKPHRAETQPDGSILRGAVAGAIIGEVVDDDSGHGAAAGASLGALKRGDDIAYPAGALISLKLAAPIRISP